MIGNTQCPRPRIHGLSTLKNANKDTLMSTLSERRIIAKSGYVKTDKSINSKDHGLYIPE